MTAADCGQPREPQWTIDRMVINETVPKQEWYNWNLNVGFVIEKSHCIHAVPDVTVDCPDHCILRGVPEGARQEGRRCDGCGRWQHRIWDAGISRVDYWAAVISGNTTERSCNLYKDEQATPQDTDNEEHVIFPMELESSLANPPLQDIESDGQAIPPVLFPCSYMRKV